MKLNKNEINQKLREIGDQQQLIARAVPKLPWLAAFVLTLAAAAAMGTLYQIGKVSTAAKQVQAQDVPSYSVSRVPLSEAELQELTSLLAQRHPQVKAEVTKTGELQIYLNDGRYHAEWLYALASLQSHGLDVVWDSSEFCVGRCSGPVASATVKGYKQKLTQN